jgi:hypothetical protein
MSTDADSLVTRYLDDLDHELRDVPASRRRELVDEMRDHIREARAGTGDTESDVRELLDRLGEPSEIAAEEGTRREVEPTPRVGLVELGALVGLALGFTFIGWVVGLALLWASRRWTTGDKLVGTLAWPAAVLLGLVLSLGASAPIGDDGGLGPLETTVLLAFFLAPVASVVFLALRLRRRTG